MYGMTVHPEVLHVHVVAIISMPCLLSKTVVLSSDKTVRSTVSAHAPCHVIKLKAVVTPEMIRIRISST